MIREVGWERGASPQFIFPAQKSSRTAKSNATTNIIRIIFPSHAQIKPEALPAATNKETLLFQDYAEHPAAPAAPSIPAARILGRDH
jgi:hypothetical protein